MTIKEYIQKYVLLKIVSKEWKSGDVLPSENKIAEKFGCSRITARHALGTFVRAGILKPQKGKGYVLNAMGTENLFESNTSKYNATKVKTIWLDEKTKKVHYEYLCENYTKNQDFIDQFKLEDNEVFLKEYYDEKGVVFVQVTYLLKEIHDILTRVNVEESFTQSMIQYALIPTSNRIEYIPSNDIVLEAYKVKLGWNSDPVISIKQLFLGDKLVETSVRIARRDLLRVRAKKEIIL